jgi:integrase
LIAYECRLHLVRAMKFHVPPAAMGCSRLGAEDDQRPSDPSVVVGGSIHRADKRHRTSGVQEIARTWRGNRRGGPQATTSPYGIGRPRTKVFSQVFDKVLAEAEIKDLTWHDFRHTFGTRLRAARVQIEDIRYLLGHGAKTITERYAQANLDVLREAVATLDRKNENQTGTSHVLRLRSP